MNRKELKTVCRLLMGNKDAVLKYNRHYGIKRLLEFLIDMCGGHGNGYALMRNGKITEWNKGVKLSADTIAEKLIKSDYDYCLFHTRLASVGNISDANCHPYVTKNNALAMNGTEYNLNQYARALNTTDSAIIHRMMQNAKRTEAVEFLLEFDSVFVGFYNGFPYAIKNYGALELYAPNEFDVLFASAFPYKTKNIQDLPLGYTWINGSVNVYPYADDDADTLPDTYAAHYSDAFPETAAWIN